MKNTILIICLIAASGTFAPPVDAATSRKHEINFDMMVPCVGEIVHLKGPFHVSLTFSGKSLTNAEASVNDIRGTGENTRRTYLANGNKMQSTNYMVLNGVGRGHFIVKFEIIGRAEGNPGNVIRFWAEQIVRLEFGKNLNVDFEALKVCVTP